MESSIEFRPSTVSQPSKRKKREIGDLGGAKGSTLIAIGEGFLLSHRSQIKLNLSSKPT